MVATFKSINPLSVDMGEFKPKATALTEGQVEASVTIWQEGNIETGLWECSEGVFTATRVGFAEICTILSGKVVINAHGEEPQEYGPGDIVVTPSGWEGTWNVTERVRKHFTIIND